MKMMRVVSILVVLVTALSIFSIPGIALAQDETTPTPLPESITLTTAYPTIEGISTYTFQFSVELFYIGAIDRVFDLKLTPAQGWDTFVTPQYETSKKISSITMEASETGRSQSVLVTTSSLTYPYPDPGEYTLTLEASSGELVGKVNLIAKVTAKYGLGAQPAQSLYSMTAKAGKNNTFSIMVSNTGTAPVENITFSSDKTQGWEVTFTPVNIATLEAYDATTVDINIKPPAKTVSGDYNVNVWVSGKQASADKITIRVTVETSSIWGWVGVIIILIVVVGLVLIFIRFGRR